MTDDPAENGDLYHTYVAAIQYDQTAVPADAYLLGVMRRPPPWAYGQVDENRSELGPPTDLLDTFKEQYEKRLESGMSEADAHNTAADDVDYETRYRIHLQTEAAQEGLEYVRSLLASGEDVALVCFENTAEKRCHRTILLDYLNDSTD